MSGSKQPTPNGFSLVELMVALVFTAILTTGMLRIFASNVSGFYAHQETLGLQRNSRFVLSLVQEEILQAGYLFPPRNLKSEFTVGSTTSQPPMLIARTAYTPVWNDANGFQSTDLTPVDELQFVQDLNLEVDAVLSADAAAGDTTVTINITSGIGTLNKYLTDTSATGDPNPLVMMMLDSQEKQLDIIRVRKISGTGPYTVTFDTTSSGLDKYGNPLGAGYFTGSFNNAHKAKAPCAFIAPLQVVRYTVVPRNLDPSDKTAMVPCLVRQTAPIEKAAFFAPDPDEPAPDQNSEWTEQILAEGVVGFRVDVSVDGGKNWQRYDSAGVIKDDLDTWEGTYKALDAAIKVAVPAASPIYTYAKYGIENTSDPMWFNYVPVTLRLDVDTRSRLARADFNVQAANTAAFRTRTATMLISPRNFALGSPE